MNHAKSYGGANFGKLNDICQFLYSYLAKNLLDLVIIKFKEAHGSTWRCMPKCFQPMKKPDLSASAS